MIAYKLNPTWAVRTRFTGLAGVIQPLPSDLAMLLRVVGTMSEAVPADSSDVVRFEAAMERSRSSGDDTPGCRPISYAARRVGYRDAAFARRAAERMSGLRNGGSRCFVAVDVPDGGTSVRFSVAAGAAMMPAHPCFSPSMRRSPSADAGVVYADRHHVVVRPEAFAGFRSVASYPVALRVLAWLTSPCREGLPSHHDHEVDEHGRWTLRVEVDDLPRVWGIDATRPHLGYWRDLFDRVGADLGRVGVTFKACARPSGRSRSSWTFRFWSSSAERAWGDTLRDSEDVPLRMSAAAVRLLPDGARPRSAPVAVKAVEPDTPEPDDSFDATAFAPTDDDDAPVPTPEPAPSFTPPPTDDVEHDDPVADLRAEVEAMLAPSTLPAEPVMWTPEFEPLPVLYTVHPDEDDLRPPWITRRFRYQCSEPGLWLDRLVTGDVTRAGWIDCHGWQVGWHAEPFRIGRGGDLDTQLDAVESRWAWAVWASERAAAVGDVRPTDDAGGRAWDTWMVTHAPNPRWSTWATKIDEDPEAHVPRSKRKTPYRQTERTRPHDGIGYVDEVGNPVDKHGRPMDRSAVEEAWEAAHPPI